jgi:hypothetical protein
MNSAIQRPALDAMAAILWEEAGLPDSFPSMAALRDALRVLRAMAEEISVELTLVEG